MPIPVPGAGSGGTTINPGDWTGTLNGLAFGAGTNYQLVSLTGWKQMTATAYGGSSLGSGTYPAPKPYANGSWAAPYYAPQKTVALELDVITAPGDFAAAVAALEAATPPPGASVVALSLQLDGVTTTVYGPVTQRDIPTVFEYQFGLTRATIQVEPFDVRRFGAALSATTNLPTTAGGLTWPITFPAVWSAVQQTGVITLTNSGDADGPLTVQINGPCVSPTLTHTDADGNVSVLALSLTVASGDYISIDMENEIVLYNGQSSRNGWITSRGWFTFTPGANTVAFTAGAYNSAASCTVTATPAWI